MYPFFKDRVISWKKELTRFATILGLFQEMAVPACWTPQRAENKKPTRCPKSVHDANFRSSGARYLGVVRRCSFLSVVGFLLLADPGGFVDDDLADFTGVDFASATGAFF